MIVIALTKWMFQFGSAFNNLLKRSCFPHSRALPSPSLGEIIVFAVHCTPPVLLFGCVVGGKGILSRSSLPCIAPWWFHRTSFLGHDLFPSGCSPSVFVESRGGGAPEGFHSSFRQVLGEDSVHRGEERMCTVIEQPGYPNAGSLKAESSWKQRSPSLVLFLDPQQVLSELLPRDPAGPWSLCSTAIYPLCVDLIHSRTLVFFILFWLDFNTHSHRLEWFQLSRRVVSFATFSAHRCSCGSRWSLDTTIWPPRPSSESGHLWF